MTSGDGPAWLHPVQFNVRPGFYTVRLDIDTFRRGLQGVQWICGLDGDGGAAAELAIRIDELHRIAGVLDAVSSAVRGELGGRVADSVLGGHTGDPVVTPYPLSDVPADVVQAIQDDHRYGSVRARALDTWLANCAQNRYPHGLFDELKLFADRLKSPDVPELELTAAQLAFLRGAAAVFPKLGEQLIATLIGARGRVRGYVGAHYPAADILADEQSWNEPNTNAGNSIGTPGSRRDTRSSGT